MEWGVLTLYCAGESLKLFEDGCDGLGGSGNTESEDIVLFCYLERNVDFVSYSPATQGRSSCSDSFSHFREVDNF